MLVSEFKNDYLLIHLLLQINKYLRLREYDRDGETKCSYTYGFKDIYVKLKDGKVKPSVGFLNQLRKNWFLLLFRLIMRLRWRWQNFFLQKMVVLFITFEEPYDNDGFVLQGELCKEEISCLPRASCHAQILFD